MYKSIVQSCDTYYYMLANDLGVDTIHDFMTPFGFGQLTGIDIEGEVRGLLPSTAWKRKAYRKPEQQKWYAGETISLGIGQGYNSFTMLQLAHAMATLANDGVRMKPHLVHEVVEIASARERASIAAEPARAGCRQARAHRGHPQRDGRREPEGTSAARVPRRAVHAAGGKTGTAQVVGHQGRTRSTTPRKVDERHRDHALFIAYAPADDPQIALAMVVENAGFGAQAAAPIARRVFDYWLRERYPSRRGHRRRAARPGRRRRSAAAADRLGAR